VWNEIVFQSFQCGNLKEIDLDVYRQLKSAISKRMYRFLDKRFYQRANLDFDLSAFAFEHIGISRSSSLSEVKRALTRPIQELEAIGFIKVLPREERFLRQGRGLWRVVFQRGASEARVLLSAEQTRLVDVLKERGISPQKASRLVRSYPQECILEKVAVHDWMVSKGDKRCRENPAGFLVAAIQGDYPPPAGFLKSKEEAKAGLKVVTARAPRVQQKAEQPDTEREHFSAWWSGLTEQEREKFEERALEHADSFTRKYYLAGKAEEGSLFKATREKMLLDLFRGESAK
jgi:hypothetical protein